MTHYARVLSLLLLIAPVVHGAPVTYRVAPDITAIGLSWRAFGHSFSQAHLDGVTGDLIINPAEDRDDRIDVTIPLSTLTASNRLLAQQLKSAMFFDAQRYPNIRFVSSRIAPAGAGKFRIFGLLSVKNVSRPVVMLANLDNAQALSPPPDRLTLHASTAISRSAFQLDRLSGIVDDRVDIELTIAARLMRP